MRLNLEQIIGMGGWPTFVRELCRAFQRLESDFDGEKEPRHTKRQRQPDVLREFKDAPGSSAATLRA